MNKRLAGETARLEVTEEGAVPPPTHTVVAGPPAQVYLRASVKEGKDAKRARATEVMDRLHARMPDARIELDYTTPLELLVAVMLSAQCTDKRVNLATPALFQRFRTAADYAAATPEALEPFIRTLGLYRSKAKNLVAAGKSLVERYQGEVPTRRAALEELAGVGRKTAGVVSMHLGGDEAFPVDTHVGRLSRRLGFTRKTHPDDVEADLQTLLPPARWALAHQLLVWHGRRTCTARAPACATCVVADLCPKVGVKPKPAKPKPTPRPSVRARP